MSGENGIELKSYESKDAQIKIIEFLKERESHSTYNEIEDYLAVVYKVEKLKIRGSVIKDLNSLVVGGSIEVTGLNPGPFGPMGAKYYVVSSELEEKAESEEDISSPANGSR